MENSKAYQDVVPKQTAKIDFVIAFDNTRMLASYNYDMMQPLTKTIIPNLFKNNDDVRVGIVAFGDYTGMDSKDDFSEVYQSVPLTDNEDSINSFMSNLRYCRGGGENRFCELVIKKIVDETEWRPGSARFILFISDAEPYPLGYTYKDYVVDNQIDWRQEARKATALGIKIDTIIIAAYTWYEELSSITGGVSVPFCHFILPSKEWWDKEVEKRSKGYPYRRDHPDGTTSVTEIVGGYHPYGSTKYRTVTYNKEGKPVKELGYVRNIDISPEKERWEKTYCKLRPFCADNPGQNDAPEGDTSEHDD